MKKTFKITEKMTMGEIIRDFPGTAPVFLKYGLHCVGCPMANPETIEEAAQVHQIEIKKFIKELNQVIKQK